MVALINHLLTYLLTSSSWWRTPSRALPYWWLDAKYPFPLPSSKPCGPQSSGAECPRLSLSARWILDDQSARQRWHVDGPPLELIEPGARKISIRMTWPFQRLASSPWCSWLCYLHCHLLTGASLCVTAVSSVVSFTFLMYMYVGTASINGRTKSTARRRGTEGCSRLRLWSGRLCTEDGRFMTVCAGF